MKIKIQALTPLWTGGVDQSCDRLHETGLIGSLRWWFKVLVRGLGGKACDPTVPNVRCPDEDGKDCVVCEVFGCTGSARKFRLIILDDQGNVIQGQIKAGQAFILRFIPLRPIAEEEWCLLDATLRLIADYGAIGGKTVFKPSEEWGIADLGESDPQDATNGGVKVKRSRGGLPLRQGDIIRKVNHNPVSTMQDLQRICAPLPHGTPITVEILRGDQSKQENVWAGKRHHQDFGLIEVLDRPSNLNRKRESLESYVQNSRWCKPPHRYRDDRGTEQDYSWASLSNFWCVKGRFLARQDQNTSSFNFVIGRPEPKRESSQGDSWLAGRQQESKKVFSFNPDFALAVCECSGLFFLRPIGAIPTLHAWSWSADSG